MSSKQKLYLAIGIIIVLSFLGLFIYQKATAQTWVEPNCDPSAAEGPAACAVSAPLNTSDDAQTKTGSLIIDDTFATTGLLSANGGLTGQGAINFSTAASVLVPQGSTEPLTPSLGSIFFNTDLGNLEIYTSTGWSRWVKTTGDTMSGPLLIAGASLTADNIIAKATNPYFSLQNLDGLELMRSYINTATTPYSNTLTVGVTGGVGATVLPGTINITNGAINKITLTGNSGIIGASAVTAGTFANNNGTGDVLLRGGNGTSIAGNTTIQAGYLGAAISKNITLNTYDSGVTQIGAAAAGNGLVNIYRANSASTTPALTVNNLDTDASAITATSGSATTISASSNGSGTALQGSSNTGLGVYGNTTTGSGVKGCYNGANCGTLGTSRQAGVFEGDTYAWGDVIGSKFLPTNMQYSPYPYLQKKINTKTQLSFYMQRGLPARTYQVLDMVWDGSYMWMAAERSGTYPSNFVVLKVRKDDLEVADVIEDYAYSTYNPVEMVDTGEKLGFVDQNKTAPFSCNMLTVDKKKMSITALYSLPYATGCKNIVSDGSNLIIPAPTADSGHVTSGDKIYLFNIDRLSDRSWIDFSDNSLVCHNPTYVFYDGYNLWASCSTTAGTEIPNAIIKITDYTCSYGSKCIVNSYNLYNDSLNIDKLFFDGGYLWATYDAGPTPLRKLDPDHTYTSGEKTFLNVAKDFTGTSVNMGITDIDFDGANIWLSNNTTSQIHIIPAYGPDALEAPTTVSGTLKLEYDGMNMWNSFTSTAHSYDANGISIWSTSNGSFSSESNNKTYRGIRMTGTHIPSGATPPASTEKYCVIIDDSGGTGAAFLRLFSKTAAPADYDKYCAE